MSEPELRRPLAPGETLVRCKTCGRIDIPLNEEETWHYVRTGEGLGDRCGKPRPIAVCKFERLPPGWKPAP